MRFLRAVVRLPLLLLVTFLVHAALTLLHLLRRRWPHRWLRWRNRVYRGWARAMGRLIGMRLRIEGTPPEGRFVLISNHLSYMDIMVLAAAADVAFVAKSELADWPAVGRVIAAADTIFIDRSRRRDVVRAMAEMEAVLDLPLGVALFAEGTSGRGDRLLPFRPSLLQVPAGAREPVRFATIHYRTPEGWGAADEWVCWYGDAPFVPHVLKLVQLPFFDAVVRFGDLEILDVDRKRLAERLYTEMEAIFEPSAAAHDGRAPATRGG